MFSSALCYRSACSGEQEALQADVGPFLCRREALGGAVRVPYLHSGLAPEEASAGFRL